MKKDNNFSFFDDEQTNREEPRLRLTDDLEAETAEQIILRCKPCQKVHFWLECAERVIN